MGASLSIVAIVFLQLPHALRSGRITRVETLSDWLARHAPRFGATLQGFYSLLGAALFIVLGALVVRFELVRLPHVLG